MVDALINTSHRLSSLVTLGPVSETLAYNHSLHSMSLSCFRFCFFLYRQTILSFKLTWLKYNLNNAQKNYNRMKHFLFLISDRVGEIISVFLVI